MVSTLLIYLFCNVISAAGSHDFIITNKGDETIYAAAGSTYKSLVESKFFCVGWFKIEPGRSNTIYGVSHQGNIYLAFAKMGDNGVMESIGVWSEEGYYKEPEGFNIPVTADNFRYNVDYQEDKFQTKKLNNGFVRIPFTVRFDVRNTLGSNDEYTTYFTVNSSLEHPVFSEIPDGADSTEKPFYSKVDEMKKEAERTKKIAEEKARKIEQAYVNPKYLSVREKYGNGKIEYEVDVVKVIDVGDFYERGDKIFFDYTVEIEDDLYTNISSKTFRLKGKMDIADKSGKYNQINIVKQLIEGNVKSIKMFIVTYEDYEKEGNLDRIRTSLCRFKRCMNF